MINSSLVTLVSHILKINILNISNNIFFYDYSMSMVFIKVILIKFRYNDELDLFIFF